MPVFTWCNSKKNKKKKQDLEKFNKGSISKSQNEIPFQVLAKSKNGNEIDKKMFIWSYNPNSMLNGFKDDIDSIIENIKNSKKIRRNLIFNVSTVFSHFIFFIYNLHKW